VLVLVLEETGGVKQVVLEMDVELVTLFDQKSEHVWLIEGGSEVHGHVVITEGDDIPLQKGEGLVVLSDGDVLDVDIEQLIPILLDEGQVDWLSPLNGSVGVSVDWIHFVLNIGESELVHWYNCISLHCDLARIRELNDIGVLLLHDDSEVIGLTHYPLALWSKCEGLGDVIVEHEWWVPLFGIQIIVDEDEGLIIVFVIGQRWKLIGLCLIDINDVDCLKIFDEIGETVGENLGVKVQLDQLVESGATSKDGSVLADIIFILSKD
jgi:hypothetical protein